MTIKEFGNAELVITKIMELLAFSAFPWVFSLIHADKRMSHPHNGLIE